MLFIVFKNVHTHHQIPGYATALYFEKRQIL